MILVFYAVQIRSVNTDQGRQEEETIEQGLLRP